MTLSPEQQLHWARLRIDAALVELKLAIELLVDRKGFEAEQLAHLGGLLVRIRDRIK